MDDFKLTTDSHWRDRHKAVSADPVKKTESIIRKRLHQLFPKAPWDESLAERKRWYIADQLLPCDNKLRVVEIGCAPGNILLSYWKRYGYEPWGIEYTHEGVVKTREMYSKAGLDPSQVHEGDFFSDEVTEKYSEFFDVVTSHGFIEHFTDPLPVLERHLKLLRRGGYLVVTIPNLRGFNNFRIRGKHREKIALHNLDIMEQAHFNSLFFNSNLDLEVLFTGFIGTMSLRHFFPSWMPDFESVFEKMLWLALGDRGLETSFFSPHIMCIARRK